MIIVTGAAGFIGSNLIAALNARGDSDIIAVDRRAADHPNLRGLRIAKYFKTDEFLDAIARGILPEKIVAIYHQGACSDTTCDDEVCMRERNFEFPCALLDFAAPRRIPLVYASSAAVYGGAKSFTPAPENEHPLNLYGRSKLDFDNYVRKNAARLEGTVVGLRYFNVYGPREAEKGPMASMAYQLYRQLKTSGCARLFKGTGGWGDGEQRRDFVFVGDIVRVNLWFGEGPPRKGIFNVGTGISRSFNDMANILIGLLGRGAIEYVPFPAKLIGRFQDCTQADLSALRNAGFNESFASLEDGIARSVNDWDRESQT
ncbi:MAG TPA: ADP-glyceromanno-heptose 6-epimerase [Candidatus Binataceae bacterium]|nr:ADP-glyceromanno-heptose 6-epimerase [Candidatus Binataceae bacterium]